ncbi:hypothetical protein DFJ74DRAFT_647273 [Hyaloraphidium curvatum]|nr:hypothetical protein DFJ74DRAFT_647273 [Hyaloraphidium curvatum]
MPARPPIPPSRLARPAGARGLSNPSATPVHLLPISSRISWLLDLARSHSAEFCSPDAQLALRRHLALHPTRIVVLGCMDGRINLPVATRSPTGAMLGFRNIGGKFDLGWPGMGATLSEEVGKAADGGSRVLALVTYHYSRGSHARGCAGWGNDTEAAKRHTGRIGGQIGEMFGLRRDAVFPLLCGFETDEDALVLHGSNGDVMDVSTLEEGDRPGIRGRLDALFPDMHPSVRNDLVPLILGNMDHIAELRTTSRALDIVHHEWILAVGRGFDFLHVPNQALIVGTYSPDLATPIATAAKIVHGNMASGRVNPDGMLLLAAAPYTGTGVDRARARMKAAFLRRPAHLLRPVYPAFRDCAAQSTADKPVRPGKERLRLRGGSAMCRAAVLSLLLVCGAASAYGVCPANAPAGRPLCASAGLGPLPDLGSRDGRTALLFTDGRPRILKAGKPDPLWAAAWTVPTTWPCWTNYDARLTPRGIALSCRGVAYANISVVHPSGLPVARVSLSDAGRAVFSSANGTALATLPPSGAGRLVYAKLRQPVPAPAGKVVNSNPTWMTMPDSWCNEVVWVRVKDGAVQCEQNSPPNAAQNKDPVQNCVYRYKCVLNRTTPASCDYGNGYLGREGYRPPSMPVQWYTLIPRGQPIRYDKAMEEFYPVKELAWLATQGWVRGMQTRERLLRDGGADCHWSETRRARADAGNATGRVR